MIKSEAMQRAAQVFPNGSHTIEQGGKHGFLHEESFS